MNGRKFVQHIYINMTKEKKQTALPIADLVPNVGQITGVPRNPRKWEDAALEELQKSITEDAELLEARPLLVYPYQDERGERLYCVIGGNMRLSACKLLGYTTAPCYIYPEDTPAEKLRRVALKDNVTKGEWDADLLAEWPEDLLEGFDLLDVDDVKLDPVENATPAEYDDDETPAEETEPDLDILPGDVYRLGDHLLMCGDATSADDVARLTNGEPVDLVFTDPPYGMKKEADGVLNDNLNFEDLLAFNKRWASVTFNALKGNGSWYCWGISEPLMDIYAGIIRPMQKAKEVTFRNLIIWYKGAASGQNSPEMRSYAAATEKCLFVMKGQALKSGGRSYTEEDFFEGYEPIRAYLVGELKKSGLTKAQIKDVTNTTSSHYFTRSQWAFPIREHYLAMREASGGRAFLEDYDKLERQHKAEEEKHRAALPYFDNTHDNFSDVWLYESNTFGTLRTEVLDEAKEAGAHATPKPLFICRRGILSSSRPGEVVLDVFGGSGSTLIACEQTGRRCRMLELDPHWCSVIVRRWERYTGKQAEKIKL